MKELERLRYNSSLVELDLRLNPITKEENDYRLFLIHILPSLKTLDDRAIRDSERQMAIAYFEQSSNGNGLEHKIQQLNHGYDAFPNGNSAITARVKSVSNIAKRSAGKLTNQIKPSTKLRKLSNNWKIHHGVSKKKCGPYTGNGDVSDIEGIRRNLILEFSGCKTKKLEKN